MQNGLEECKKVGDPSQGESGDPGDEHSKVEAPDRRKEVLHPQRRASTPPGHNLQVKVLTRLGSLDGELTYSIHKKGLCTPCRVHPTLTSDDGSGIPSQVRHRCE